MKEISAKGKMGKKSTNKHLDEIKIFAVRDMTILVETKNVSNTADT